MVMKHSSAWHKNNSREIKLTLERYIAILVIIALGTGFFSGLRITKSAMVETFNNYVAKYQMYDYRLISTLGLTKEDVEYFSSQDGTVAKGAVSVDFIADHGSKKEIVLRAHSITDSVNKLNIVSGRMAEANNECIVDSRYFSKDDIGSTIRVSSSNDEDTTDNLAYEEYTIVGLADSVNYISHERGITKIAGGSIKAFVYIPEDGFSMDFYTEILIKLADNSEVYSDEYKALISSKESYFEEELAKRADLRYQNISSEADEKIAEAQKDYDEGYEKYLLEKADAMAELEDARKKLEDARIEIQENEITLRDGEKKLASAEKEYNDSLSEYKKSFSEYETKKASTLATLESQKSEVDSNHKSVTSAMKQIESSGVLEQYHTLTETIRSLESALSQIGNPESPEYVRIRVQLEQAKTALANIEATGVIQQYAALESNLIQLDAAQKELAKAKKEAEQQFSSAESELIAAGVQLDSAKEQIDTKKKEIRDGWTALEEGKAEYEKGLKDYEDGKKEADESFASAEEELAKGKKEIDDAKEEIKDISEPNVFVMDRSYNSGYASFDNDSSIVDGIAKVLPIFFFLVAALVCSTTMTRMVDEQRTQIGTSKALGYSNGAITRKYIFYSGSASVLGCIFGYLLGTKYFPMAIWTAYGMLYGFAPIVYVFDMGLAIISLVASLLCSAGVTYLSCKSELTQMPAELIRPKAPKSGRRVILERVQFIWNKISFLHKVSIRNILRYRKRLLMTVLGVAGCAALVLAALGISDSISNIVDDQFNTIMTYDYDIYFSEEQSRDEIQKFTEEYSGELSECVFVSTGTFEILSGNSTKKSYIVATDDPDISNIIGLYSNGKKIPYPGSGKAVVNDKLAKNSNVSVGDTITIKISDTEMVDLEVGGIFENYMNNYIYMTGETYKTLFGEDPLYKSAYAATEKEDLYAVSALLSNDDKVASVSVLNDMRGTVDNMMQSLNYIIWLVIACAGVLAFVVMYNLNNINITERTREIATIKVLGFYAKETHSYIFRETLLLTAIGALLGLGLGKLLHKWIMSQITVEAMTFKEQIFPVSYISAVVVTFILTFLVSLMLRRKINNINMAESLKSVE